MKPSQVKLFAGPGIRLAVLSVLLLGMAGVCMAQASAAAAQPAARAAVAPQIAVAPQAKPSAQPAQTGAPAPKGTSEGIKVHGHWTIEVKNPDGTLVTHREFENSLSPSGGAQLLAALLNRTASAGGWFIVLSNAPGGNTSTIFEEPMLEASENCAEYASNPTINCNYNLEISGPTQSGAALSGSGTLTLTSGFNTWPGSAPAIGYAGTGNFPCPPSDFDGGCLGTPSALDVEEFTQRTLDGQNGDPAPLPISSGQQVGVTVVISFQ